VFFSRRLQNRVIISRIKEKSYLFILKGDAMIEFLFSIAIPFLASPAGTSLKALKGAAKHTLWNIDFFLLFAQVFLLFVLIFGSIFLVVRIKRIFVDRQIKQLLIFLYRLHDELLLYRYVENVKSADRRVEIELSKEESIKLIQNIIKKKFFGKCVGENEVKRIMDGLKLIKDDEIDTDVQLLLVNNWIELIKFL
jgi:hypothetical protein